MPSSARSLFNAFCSKRGSRGSDGGDGKGGPGQKGPQEGHRDVSHSKPTFCIQAARLHRVPRPADVQARHTPDSL